MKTLYLSKMPHDLDLMILEETIGREVIEVHNEEPAINIDTINQHKVNAAVKFLGKMGIKASEAA